MCCSVTAVFIQVASSYRTAGCYISPSLEPSAEIMLLFSGVKTADDL